MDEDLERILGRMVRVGIVTSVDIPARRARVKFEDEGDSSGPLRVLSSPPFIPIISKPQQTEPAAGHSHEVKVTPWLPKVNDTVLTLYLPTDDSDGYILGRIEEGTN